MTPSESLRIAVSTYRKHNDEVAARHARRCGGRFRNGPGKRYVRCAACGALDYEKNEGDLHAGPPRERTEP